MNQKTRKALARVIELVNAGTEWPDASAEVYGATNLSETEKAWLEEAYDSDSGTWSMRTSQAAPNSGSKTPPPRSPYELGRASAGADVENPFGQYAGNEQGTGSDTAWDEWEDGRADAEQKAGEAYAETFDRSMRDVYHPDEG